ncbi:MAG: D-alanyl-D-alanine carboxypeptidase/D-alanyl-D-alanine-endopeptidase [Phycisphaerae bacterium]|nr:D-alanyl-D-alanine carboxypeptidase/D-alanyl-D-alanine-endopeptidase [Phycisphaerae bacterium]
MSKRGMSAWRCAALLVGLLARVALAGDVPANFGQRLDNALAKLPKSTDVGLVVIDADDGQSWFARNDDLPLKPASVMKLFVTAAALERFGDGFAFETRVYLSGDELWVVGGGDPALCDERLATRDGKKPTDVLDAWAAAIKTQQRDSITKLVLDDHVFEQQQRHPDWDRAQWNKWYAAPVGGLNIADNCVDFSVHVAGDKVAMTMQPALPAAFVRNELRVGRKYTAVIDRQPGSDVFELRGAVVRGSFLGTASAGHATIFFGFVLREALERHGVKVQGEVVRRSLDDESLRAATLLSTHRTPLRDVIWRCNTFSQNLFAECLLKSLAAYDENGRPTLTAGSWTGGTAIVRTTIEGMSVNLKGAVLRDGSGLSHENRVTAGQITALLRAMRAGPHRQVFADSLARPGEDGTLRRIHDAQLQGRLMAKTGTISGVRSLAGYVTRPDGTTLAFALLINGSAPSDLPGRVAKVLAE